MILYYSKVTAWCITLWWLGTTVGIWAVTRFAFTWKSVRYFRFQIIEYVYKYVNKHSIIIYVHYNTSVKREMRISSDWYAQTFCVACIIGNVRRAPLFMSVVLFNGGEKKKHYNYNIIENRNRKLKNIWNWKHLVIMIL